MTTSDEIQRMIADLEAEKRAAEAAERARIEAEQAHRRAIAEKEARIRELQQQAIEARFEEGAAAYKAMVAGQAPLIEALQSDLDDIGGRLAGLLQGGTAAALQSSFEQALRHADAIIGAVQSTVDYSGGSDSQTDASFRVASGRAHAHFVTLDKRLEPHSVPVYAVIARWIDEAPDELTRQIRRGVAFALTGYTLNPSKGYNPQDDIRQRRQSRSV